MGKILFVILIFSFVSFSQPVKASQSSDEYSQIKEGFLLDNTNEQNTLPDQVLKNTSSNPSKSLLTMEKILNEYKLGNYIEIFDGVKIKAEEEQPEAQELLGIMYRLGQGTDKHPQESLKWLTKAAENELPIAQYHLGILLSIGDVGVDKDLTEALKWLKISTLLYNGNKPAEKEMIETAYSSVLQSANRRQKKEALEKINSWLKIKNKQDLIVE